MTWSVIPVYCNAISGLLLSMYTYARLPFPEQEELYLDENINDKKINM